MRVTSVGVLPVLCCCRCCVSVRMVRSAAVLYCAKAWSYSGRAAMNYARTPPYACCAPASAVR